jgi:protein-arginine kinase activator protein McsA
MTRLRTKRCDRCQQSAAVLYRVKVDESDRWVFVCDRCYPTIRQNNPHYTYGGTWKAKKK